MIEKKRLRLMLITAAGFALLIAAQTGAMPIEGCGPNTQCNSCHSLSIEEANIILKDVGQVKEVKHSTVRGLFELTIENQGRRAIAYMDYGKKHLIPAPIFNIASRRPVTDQLPQFSQPATIQLDKIPLNNSIVMGNPSGKKRLFVFTDPDCPYCAKLHIELKALIAMEPDLAVYVKLFPLDMHPNAFVKSRVIMGAKNSLELLDKAFSGETLPKMTEKDVAGPVEETIRLGRSMGINSTPTLVLPDGRVMPGYREAAELRKLINETSSK
jgi:thiol:disulfide interchange protein DsbC